MENESSITEIWDIRKVSMENESSITELVLEPSKTYHIGDGNGFRIYLQAVHFEKKDYSIRVIIGGEDFHSKFIKQGYIWDIQQGLNKEDFIFKTLQEAETKLEELATLNNWIGYY